MSLTTDPRVPTSVSSVGVEKEERCIFLTKIPLPDNACHSFTTETRRSSGSQGSISDEVAAALLDHFVPQLSRVVVYRRPKVLCDIFGCER
jgi:hypothetical protein